MRDIKWRLEKVSLSKIKVIDGNPKKKTDGGINLLRKSIDKIGVVFAGILNSDYTLIDGHSRLEELKQQGVESENYLIPDTLLSRKEFKEARALFDMAKVSDIDYDMIIDDIDLGEDFLSELDIEIKDIDYDIEKVGKKSDTFIDDFNSINDTNCKMPIVPNFFEEHECFIIPVHNSIDVKFIRDLFGLNVNHISNSGDKKERKTNVVSIEKIRECLM